MCQFHACPYLPSPAEMMDGERSRPARRFATEAIDLTALTYGHYRRLRSVPLLCNSQAAIETAGPDAPLCLALLDSNFSLKEFLEKRTEAKACEKGSIRLGESPGVVHGVPAGHKRRDHLAADEGRSSQRASPSYRAF
jgi:hypothetical protein